MFVLFFLVILDIVGVTKKKTLTKFQSRLIIRKGKQKVSKLGQIENIFLHKILQESSIYSVTDVDGTIIEVNDKFCEIMQYPREELIGKNHRVVASGIHPKQFYEQLWNTILSGQVWKGEVCNRTKNGELRWLDSIITPEFDSKGDIVKFYAYRTNITLRKEKEENAKRMLFRYESVVNATKEGVFEWDLALNRIIVSSRWISIMGCENEAFITKINNFEYTLRFEDVVEMIGEKHQKRLFAGFYEDFITKKHFDFTIQTKKGRWIKTSAQKIGDGENPDKIIGSIADVTELQQHQTQLEEQTLLLKEFSQKIPGFLYQFVMTSDGHFSFPYAGDGIRDIYEVSPEEVKHDASLVFSRIHPDDLDRVSSSILKSAQTLTKWTEETRLILPIKGERWAKGVARPNKLENGDIVWYGYISDITQQKEQFIEVEKAKEKAEEANKIKSSFIANMSHEIRTPMNGIIGFSQFLAEPDLSEDERIEFAGILQKSTKRLLNLVEDIINISRLESNSLEVHNSEINLNDLLDEVYMLNLPLFEQKQLYFLVDYEFEKENANIISDETKIQNIISNIISNAYKFTEKGGVHLSYIYSKEVNKIKFRISDTGVGMSEEFLGRVFDVFAQEDISYNRTYEGAGLGLPIVKGYLQLMGGNINITSVKNEGTTVEFCIPYTPAYT